MHYHKHFSEFLNTLNNPASLPILLRILLFAYSPNADFEFCKCISVNSICLEILYKDSKFFVIPGYCFIRQFSFCYHF